MTTIFGVGTSALVALVLAVQSGPVTLDRLAWLAGCWQGSTPGREYRERWSKPMAGMMLGTSQTVRDGRTVEYEFLQLVGDENGVVYVARPSRQAEASFKLIEGGPQVAIFENKQHDFPQRIIYRLGAAGALVARIEGIENGAARGVDFPMMRTPCE